LKHFKQHRWLAFIDADEFFVFPQQNNSTSSGTQGPSTISSSSSQNGTQPGLQDTALLPGTQQPEPLSQDRGQFRFVDELEHDITQDNVLELSDSASQQGSHASVIGSSSSSSLYTQPHSLAMFLSDFEGQGAVGVNWVLFGSSGHLARPVEGPLGAYTACIPRTHWESTHVKVRIYRRCTCCPVCRVL
jgi:hypothetical protein